MFFSNEGICKNSNNETYKHKPCNPVHVKEIAINESLLLLRQESTTRNTYMHMHMHKVTSRPTAAG